MTFSSNINTIDWLEPDKVQLIDQTKLPYEFVTVTIKTYKQMEEAIQKMLIRGAPAIGIAGAFGLVLGAIEISNLTSKEAFFSELISIANHLKASRPTAVNLEWGINRLINLVDTNNDRSIPEIIQIIKTEAIKMHQDDLNACKSIGKFGATIIPKSATILTHCNAGALATVGYGTALGVVRSAFEKDPSIKVFADETRPRQQGARLTTWELLEDKIPTTLITDGMCAHLMSKKMIAVVVVGADRIAANGDTANKIGTLTLAIVAKEYKIPFYIAAPLSTIDINIPDGSFIPIEERDKEEVTTINNKIICHRDVNVINPAFDVTPANYIAGIITERGIIKPDYTKSIADLFTGLLTK